VNSTYLGTFIAVAVAGLVFAGAVYVKSGNLSDTELKIAKSLSLADLPPVPVDPSNSVADNPLAADLGKALFHDTGLSANGNVACATCHIADRQFQDDLSLGQGIGQTNRRTMPLRGVAYATWLFWDGRKDSLWSQAFGPLENAAEHGFTRSEVAAYIAENYRDQYVVLFGTLPDLSGLPPASPLGREAHQANWRALPKDTRRAIDTVFANTGKSIAAFERTLMPLESRFDRYVSAVLAGEKPAGDAALSRREIKGFRIFIDKGQCINCHNGPRLTDEFFHNTGVPARPGAPKDRGRVTVLEDVKRDPFNCLGPYSDASPDDCGHLTFMSHDVFLFTGAFKPPSLRGVAGRPPYMHAGQFDTLDQVIEHYDIAPFTFTGQTELHPLKLTFQERAALLAFLETL